MGTENFILDFIEKPEEYYLDDRETIDVRSNFQLSLSDVVFYRIDRITFEEKAPRKEALENVLSAMRIKGVNFLYLIRGNAKEVAFYYGISRDLVQKISLQYPLKKLGNILKTSLEGNFRGSKLTLMDESQTQSIIDDLYKMPFMGCMDGVPGINKEKENFQGVDRLVDAMLGDEFALLVTAKPLPYSSIRNFEKNVYDCYDKLLPLSKKNVQKGENDNITIVETKTAGTTVTETDGTQTGTNNNFGTTYQESRSVATTNTHSNETRTETTGTSDNSDSYSKSSGTSHSTANASANNTTIGTNKAEGKSSSTSYEFSNKEAQEWIKYIDEVILKRLDYGKGKGIYISTISLYTMTGESMIKLENTVTSLFSGESGNKVPLRSASLQINGERKWNLKNLQIPIGEFHKEIPMNEVLVRTALSQYVTQQRIYLGNWLSVNELSIIAGLPQKEVVGLALREEVDFGLNYKTEISAQNAIVLGNLIQSGKPLNVQVCLDRDELTKHTFVTGVTGSGKTTTCQKLIIQSHLPFLVIEPAKTEYRILTKQYDDVLIFTLGKDTAAPFRLNPFEFYPHESITSHVDMIKASIESAFDMEAAIPQIIEKALYECYEDCGWDIYDNSNSYYADPFADGVYAFPTLSELVIKTTKVVEQQGFDERLKNDYIGSIKARLQGLIVGSKGLMLNTYRSIDFRELVHRRVILELEEVHSATEKALVMGFIISNLMEAIRAEYMADPDFKHITLVEEAHRLLSKYEPGDSLSKKNGVEIFADMLAEVRKYGESLIIVDQIPGKLTPEILKNTNTKIVHKIFAMDDKESIGNAMALSDDQKEFLSLLDKGRAIVFSQGWDTSMQVQIAPETDTSSNDIVSEQEIHNIAIDYYCSCYKRGIYQSLIYENTKPNAQTFHNHTQKRSELLKLQTEFNRLFRSYKVSHQFKEVLKNVEDIMSLETISRYLRDTLYYKDPGDLKLDSIHSLLKEIENGNSDISQYNETLSYGRRI